MIGIDILSINKLEEKLDTKFIEKVFTENEISYAFKKENPSESLAGIFALKESVIKAYDLKLSYIIRKRIEVVHKKGRPLAFVDGKKLDANVSISHDGGYAVGVCLKESKISKLDIRDDIKNILLKRKKDSHKGTFGKIAILGGSEGMAGSCYLSSTAALRAGGGLVYVLAPKSISKVLEIKSTEQIINTIDSDKLKYNENIFDQILKLTKNKDVLAIGPGMGTDPSLSKLIKEIIVNFDKKILIDADGLNAIAKDKSILKLKADLVITPHLKEFSRLSGLSIDQINKDRKNIAEKFAKKYGLILVLKSENTIVTDGSRTYINEIGNPGMATAGSGDVLTGIIAALLHIYHSFEAAKLGVYLHSLAGDLASFNLSEESMLASDIISYLPEAFKLLR